MNSEQIEILLSSDVLSDEQLDVIVRALEAEYGAPIRRWLRKAIGTMEGGSGGVDEDDFVQELLVKVIEGRVRMRDASKLRSFLMRSVRNSFIDFVRSRRAETKDPRFWERWAEFAGDHRNGDPAEIIANCELIEVLAGQLPWPLRSVTICHVVHGLSLSDIARMEGVPRGRVVRRWYRARALLQAALEARLMDRRP